MNPDLLKLYLVTDFPDRYPGGLLAGVEAALDGGVTIVQYRAETGTDRQHYETLRALREMLRRRKVPLIINNRADLALAIDADGLHIGQRDLPPDIARKIIGSDKILGLSITQPGELYTVDAQVLDYIGIGPVYPTVSKEDAASALGVQGLKLIAESVPLPNVAIGGITSENISEVMNAGANGVAVVSALSRSEDPASTARELLKASNAS